MQLVKQSTAVRVRVFMTSTANNESPGLAGIGASLVVKLCKPGDSTYSTITPTSVTDLGGGSYDLLLTTTHTNTLGPNNLRVTGPNAYPNDEASFQVVAFNPEDLILGSLPSGAVVADGGNGAATFKTNLTQTTDDYWKDTYCVITSGVLIEQIKRVSGYNGTTKFITVASPGFTGTPATSVTFYLVNK